MASTFSCRIRRRSRSIVSLGLVSSSITSSNLRPAMPPALFIRSVAHCTARMPHSPAVPAAPDRGAMMPILRGLSCASAGANSRGAAAATRPVAASLLKWRRVSFMEFPPRWVMGASAARLLPYHKYIRDFASSAFSGNAAKQHRCRPNRLVIYQTAAPRTPGETATETSDGTDLQPDDRAAAQLPGKLPLSHRRLVQWLDPRLRHLCDRLHRAVGLFRQHQQSALVGA